MTTEEFARILELMRGCWHRTFTPPRDVLEVWEALLLDLDGPTVAAAIQSLATDGLEFAPPPGAVRRRALELQPAGALPSASAAWAEIQTEIGRIGWTKGMTDFTAGAERARQPRWSHPIVGLLAERMGWDDLCQSENVMADRAHFIKLYDVECGRSQRLTSLPPAAAEVVAALDLSADRELAR